MDISIKNLKSYVFEPKTESLRIARAKELTSQNIIVTEKVDGTKLTLVRTNESGPDYKKNWIVSYKGNVLDSSEFDYLSGDDRGSVAQNSVGIGQYALVFSHLESINKNIGSLPKSYEFSVEFAQNKDTLTRTYSQKGGMFLRSYAKVDYRIVGGQLFTNPIGTEETDQKKLQSVAQKLGIVAFPVFYNGRITNGDIKKNSSVIWNRMEASGVDWDDPIDVLKRFSETMVEIPSTLGGQTEGVVYKTEDGKFFKSVQKDQYDAETRMAKKGETRMDTEKTTEYFKKIRKILIGLMDKVKSGSSAERMSKINKYVSSLPDSELPEHEKKTALQIRDDFHETLRLLVSKGETLGGNETKKIGLIPIAGKPLHVGHWKLIEKAASENDMAVVYTSDKDRAKKGEFPIYGKDFVKFWSDFFIPNLPKNVRVKIVDSPVRAVLHELGWYEQQTTLDKIDPPEINIYSDVEDAASNFSSSELAKFPTLSGMGRAKAVGVDRNSTVNISGTKMREFLLSGDRESFIKYLPPISQSEKEKIWDTLMKNKPKDPMAEFINELINAVAATILNESGKSTAMVDPKTPKTVNGEEAMASKKLSIVGPDGKDLHGPVSDDIKELAIALNGKVKFWNKNNPYIHNGHIFNGSSQFLMDPTKRGELIGVKNTFGDIDVIIPKAKLDTLRDFLDTIDDGSTEWKPTSQNSITSKFQYVGRTKSFASIPDQLVTLWYYAPARQVVQVDFEGDDMTTDAQGFEKPSEWTKFTKDSPWDDLKVGIKGLAGAIMLRALARATSQLDNAIVLTGRGLKAIQAGATELKTSDVSNNARHAVPAKYTLNTGGGGTGIRQAYKFVKTVNFNGKQVDAYRFVEAKETTPDERIVDVGEVFKVIFGKPPSGNEKTEFRSFQGQLKMMKKYLLPKTLNLSVKIFQNIISDEALSDAEHGAITGAVKSILGISI
jgi:hypothetical protein